ncbi:MAG: hypothetical protein K0S80_4259, partial [Neobacillus sp.]|nr:hypothetical protein [Neobacillus sp.]
GNNGRGLEIIEVSCGDVFQQLGVLFW